MTSQNKWLFVNHTSGTTAGGMSLDDKSLSFIALACEIQANRDHASEWGGLTTSIRVGTLESANPDEKIHIFLDSFPNPEDAGASAYHTVQSGGREAAFTAISTCQDLFGLQGVGMDASHETLEDADDPGCNRACDDGNGTMHMVEVCDICEIQGYAIPVTNENGSQAVFVSNFVLPSWTIAGAPAPFTFMAKFGMDGAVDPPGPFQISASPDGQGNYEGVFPSNLSSAQQVFGKKEIGMHVRGNPRRMQKTTHPWSRMARIKKRTERKEAP